MNMNHYVIQKLSLSFAKLQIKKIKKKDYIKGLVPILIKKYETINLIFIRLTNLKKKFANIV